MNEYAVKWPLWTGRNTQKSEWKVSDELATRIEAWAANFNANYDVLKGWPDPQSRDAHQVEGAALANLLQAELGDEWLVKFKFWEQRSAT